MLAARRLEAHPGLLTLRGGQFMFDCFQNLKPLGLEERILADLTLKCRVWSLKAFVTLWFGMGLWAELGKTLEPVSTGLVAPPLGREATVPSFVTTVVPGT